MSPFCDILLSPPIPILRAEVMASLRPEVFRARVVELGLADCLPYLGAKHLDIMSKFAYGCSETQCRVT